MTNCQIRNGVAHTFRLLLAGLLIAIPCSCRSGARHADAAGADSASSAHVDVGCMLEQVEKPAASFHYSYKYADAARRVDEEADVTPQTMQINVSDGSGTHTYHAVRSDEQSWNSAMLDLSSLSFTGMMGRMAGYDGSTVVRTRGAEQINGYQATKYDIDSSGASAADRNTFTTLFGPGSFDKGSIWMGSDGCAVKLLLDEGLSQPDGQVETRHFEISRLKG